ncbi:MAG: heat shock factor family protein [Oligoflexales bacterium]
MIKKIIKMILFIALMFNINCFASESKGGFVEHNYLDHLNDPLILQKENEKAQDSFPEKLYQLLSYVEENDLDHVVSWLPHGRSFLVHNDEEFLKIVPLFFSQSKISSFKRQLNLYSA